MSSETDSNSAGQAVWQARLRRLRFFRVLLVAALLLVGGNVARISLARRGPSATGIPAASSAEVPSTVETARTVDPQRGPSPDAAALDVCAEPETPPATDLTRATASHAIAANASAASAAPVAATEPSETALPDADAERHRQTEHYAEASAFGSGVLESAMRTAAGYRLSLADSLDQFGDSVKRVAMRGESLVREAVRRKAEPVPKEVEDLPPSVEAAADLGAVSRSFPQPDRVVLSNPLDSGGTVRFLVNGEARLLRPGDSRNLDLPGPWHIQFHHGGDFGNADYTIDQGTYAFEVTDRGWDLKPVLPSESW